MFAKKISVIAFYKDKLKVALVSLGKTPKVIKSDETGWNQESLSQTIKEASQQLKIKKIRLLLGEDLSNTVNIKIPISIKPNKERQLVLQELKSIAPEIINASYWDFKETGKKDQTQKEIIAFAPATEQFQLISQALSLAGLEIIVVEPETVAKTRNPDPIIGITLKKDLKGKDEKVLNIIPKKLTEKLTRSNLVNDSETKLTKPSVVSKKLILIFLSTFALVALITGGILTSRNALDNKSKPSPTPLVIASPDPSPEASPSATPEPEIVLADYKLLVLNGTGGKGVARTVKTILEAEGFESIKADNADKLDFIKTEIQLKKDSPIKLFDTINRALNSDYEVTRSAELLTKDSDYDVIVTVGEINSKKE